MRYFLKVYGCQMNQYDGRLIEAILGAAGHCRVDSPDRADLILINTCSVREHAETRAKGYIRMLPKGKRVGILGCLAQREGIDLIEELKVDFVLGPDCYSLLPGIIESDGPIVATNLDGELYLSIRPEPVLPVTMVTVMRGCDNYCSYCIVPYVRGNARSKPLRSVVDEVRRAVGKGAKEVLLLGQDITSYRDGDAGLAQLLEEVAVVDGLRRIRFLTSHPKGVDDKLIQVMKEINSICPHIHLPLQSGSNRILRLMKRNYTIEEYYDLVARLRREIPGIGITTDLIVGFPTETVADYEATLKAVEELRFDFAYMFKYSDRPKTEAANFKPKLSETEKIDRLKRLIRLQNEITKEKNTGRIGSEVEVLIEKRGRRGNYLGRTPDNLVVAIDGDVEIGRFYRVRLERIVGWTPVGTPI